MVKISRKHHVTKDGVIKKNPSQSKMTITPSQINVVEVSDDEELLVYLNNGKLLRSSLREFVDAQEFEPEEVNVVEVDSRKVTVFLMDGSTVEGWLTNG